jgi:hypothetical protein
VFLIGYGSVAGFNVGDEKPPENKKKFQGADSDYRHISI